MIWSCFFLIPYIQFEVVHEILLRVLEKWKNVLDLRPSQLHSVAHSRNDSLLLRQILTEQLSSQNKIFGQICSFLFFVRSLILSLSLYLDVVSLFDSLVGVQWRKLDGEHRRSWAKWSVERVFQIVGPPLLVWKQLVRCGIFTIISNSWDRKKRKRFSAVKVRTSVQKPSFLATINVLFFIGRSQGWKLHGFLH